MKEKAIRLWWFGCGAMMGLTVLSLAMAAVPTRGRVTDDTAIYQNLSEIKVNREAELNFDSDISRLSKLEGQYRESLPTLQDNPRLKAPMKRIAAQKYRYVGAKGSDTAQRKSTQKSIQE